MTDKHRCHVVVPKATRLPINKVEGKIPVNKGPDNDHPLGRV